MGTRRSKHNKGRKPKYKDHVRPTWIDTSLALQSAADQLLVEAGSADLVDHASLAKAQVFDPVSIDGETLRHPPVGKSIREPTGDVRIAKTAGEPCEGCGKPRSKYAAKLCRACYSGKAIVRYQARILDKWERQAAHFHKYSWLLEHYVEHWLLYTGRHIPNFSGQLIEDISRWEEHIGIPFVFWGNALQYVAVEDARELPERVQLPPRQAPIRSDQWKRQMQAAWRYVAA